MSQAGANDADVLIWGYDIGLFDKADIENWADGQIAAHDNPSTELLDLSTSRQLNPIDVLGLLRKFSSADSPAQIDIRIGCIGLALARNRLSTAQAIRAFWTLIHEARLTEEQRSEFYRLDDALSLAVQGTRGEMADIEQGLRRFLAPFAERLKNRFPHLLQHHP